MDRTWPQIDRRQSNPIFGDRKLKLGTFQTNLDSACIMSDLDGRHHITWPNTVACAKLADEMEFEAIVPVGALARLRRHDQSAGAGVRDLHLGRGPRRADQAAEHLRHLACADVPPDRLGQAVGRDRPHHQRSLHAQHRRRLEQARDRHVRHRRCSNTTTVSIARRNGSASSSGCGPRTRSSTTRASTTGSRRATCSPSRSRSPIPR